MSTFDLLLIIGIYTVAFGFCYLFVASLGAKNKDLGSSLAKHWRILIPIFIVLCSIATWLEYTIISVNPLMGYINLFNFLFSVGFLVTFDLVYLALIICITMTISLLELYIFKLKEDEDVTNVYGRHPRLEFAIFVIAILVSLTPYFGVENPNSKVSKETYMFRQEVFAYPEDSDSKNFKMIGEFEISGASIASFYTPKYRLLKLYFDDRHYLTITDQNDYELDEDRTIEGVRDSKEEIWTVVVPKL